MHNSLTNHPFQIFGWLEGKLGKYRSLPADLAQCVPHLFAGLEDRSADVRKNATAVLPLFMMHLTYELDVSRWLGKLKVGFAFPLFIYYDR